MTIPVVESWAPRELEDAAKLTRRINAVHQFLANPPAARITGMRRKKLPQGAFSVLPFYPPGTEPGPVTSYQTWPGMVPVSKADWTMGSDTAWQLVAPVDGRYRITIGGAFTADAGADDLRHQLWVEIGVNMTTGSGDAVAAASVDSFSPAQATRFTMVGGHSTVQRLTTGSKIQFAAKCLSSPSYGWADDEVSAQYRTGSFAELRWVGSI
ncbi:hypothetical protein ACH427_03150 [Streptomyces sp. NPDC020379]|uniref:hypothetical protein n=1 Tax=Streptomyces sp. NPDC020379 TaxID=3365071 RepID=UPI0037B10B3A